MTDQIIGQSTEEVHYCTSPLGTLLAPLQLAGENRHGECLFSLANRLFVRILLHLSVKLVENVSLLHKN